MKATQDTCTWKEYSNGKGFNLDWRDNNLSTTDRLLNLILYLFLFPAVIHNIKYEKQLNKKLYYYIPNSLGDEFFK